MFFENAFIVSVPCLVHVHCNPNTENIFYIAFCFSIYIKKYIYKIRSVPEYSQVHMYYIHSRFSQQVCR